MKGDENAKY